MARAAIYARVSTSDRYPEAQLDRLREWAERTGMDTVEFVDRRSGRCTSREALDALLAAVRRHEVEMVACIKLYLLARSTRHLWDLADAFDAAGVDLICLDQAVDTRSAAVSHLGSLDQIRRAPVVSLYVRSSGFS